MLARQRDPHRTPHKLQKHADAALVIKPLKLTEKICEGPCSDLDGLACVHMKVKVHGSVFVGSED